MHGEVVSTERLSPQLIRVVLGGSGLAGFTPTPHADQYVNCFFLPEGAGYEPPFVVDDDARELPRDQRPYPRRITVRAWDEERGELTLDIATHGDVGHAGRWAHHAEMGDLLQFRGPAGDFTPDQSADAFVLVGDESALPAIANCAAAVPPGRPVLAVVEVEDQDGEIELTSPGDLTTMWVHRSLKSGDPMYLLADALGTLTRPEGTISAFVHGEAESIRAVRRFLLSSEWVTADQLSCSPYWRRDHTDEEWRSVKKAWVREMQAEPIG